MIDYNKDEIKEELTLENIFDLLNTFGGNPEYSNFGILSDTICHNPPNEGSRKLYFYENSMLFRCYTECDKNRGCTWGITAKRSSARRSVFTIVKDWGQGGSASVWESEIHHPFDTG